MGTEIRSKTLPETLIMLALEHQPMEIRKKVLLHTWLIQEDTGSSAYHLLIITRSGNESYKAKLDIGDNSLIYQLSSKVTRFCAT